MDWSRQEETEFNYEKARRECIHKAVQKMVKGQIAIVNCSGAYSNESLNDPNVESGWWNIFYRFLLQVEDWNIDL